MCERCRDLLQDGHGPTYMGLLEQLRETDQEVAASDDDPEGTKVWKLVSKASIESMESFARPGLVEEFTRAFQKHPQLWQCAVEDHYVRECFERIPEMVRRAARLIPITITRVPRGEVRHFLTEATRCFIYGFYQATTALSRAAMESGLNEHLKHRLTYVPDVNLSVKIEKAAHFNLMSTKAALMANRVRVNANQVLHAQPASENKALQSLNDVREVLAELYEG